MPICWPGSPPSTWSVRSRDARWHSGYSAPTPSMRRSNRSVRCSRMGIPRPQSGVDGLHVAAAQPQPAVSDLSSSALVRLRSDPAIERHFHGRHLHGVHRALAALGHTGPPPAPRYGDGPVPITGTAPGWARAVERWHAISTLEPGTRDIHRVVLAKIGRWLAAEHPDIADPTDWTRQTCTAWIAAVDRMRVGDHIQSDTWRDSRSDRLGKPLSPKTKRTYIRIARTFFRDLQDWDWFPRRFDPPRRWQHRAASEPYTGPDPRVIADDVWAKLLWAGLNLDADDLPGADRRRPPGRAGPRDHPDLAVRRPAQRRDRPPARRLHPLASRATPVSDDRQSARGRGLPARHPHPQDRHGVHQAGRPAPRPGHRGMAGGPASPAADARPQDRRDRCDFLFAVRASRIADTTSTTTIIPMLCRKAGVPRADVRGPHHQPPRPVHHRHPALQRQGTDDAVRAAGLARPPLTGLHPALRQDHAEHAGQGVHTTPATSPATFAPSKCWSTATPSPAAPPQPANRGSTTISAMATAPTPSSSNARTAWPAPAATSTLPKASSKGQLLEAKENLQRMLVSIPLTDDEHAAVEDGQAALDQLLERLVDIPTPTGPTPHDIGIPPTATLLPIIAVNHGRSGPS